MDKKWIALLLAGMLTLSLCACREQTADRVERVPDPEATQTPTPTAEREKTPIEAYQEALWRLLDRHVDIDGNQISDDGWDFIQPVKFAVRDVDLDGEQELLVQYYRTTRVYGYDAKNGELVEKLWGTESCRFYDNGLVQIDSSHNQGRGGRFWPYNVSMYNPQTGKYDDVASLDAWDFELVPNPEYQKKVGAEGDEFIYYYTALGDPSDGENREETTMAQADYDAWYEEHFGDAQEIEINYWPMTVENIRQVCGTLD